LTLTSRSGKILPMERKGAKEVARVAWGLVSSRRGRTALAFLPLAVFMPLITACNNRVAGTIPTVMPTPETVVPRLSVGSWCEDDGKGGSQPVVEVRHNLKDLRRAPGEAAILLVFKKTGESRVLGILNEFGNEDISWQYRKTFTPRGKYSNTSLDYRVNEGEILTFGAYWARIISYQNMRVPEFRGKITAVSETVATCSNTGSP